MDIQHVGQKAKCKYVHTADSADRGSTVVKALLYKSKGHWFDLEFFIDIKSFWSHYGPGVVSASNRNEYQEYFLGVKRPVRKADNLTTILCRCH